MVAYYFFRWVGLIVAGLLVYAQTFRFGFVFDDHIFIVNNALIKNFSNIHLIWQRFSMTRLVGMYSFAFNYHLGQLNPAGYHIFNFIVHLTAAGLVWALAGLLFRMTRRLPDKDPLGREIPFFVALLFLVHPAQTQAVTYITQRFESMATVLYLGAVYSYLRGRLSSQILHRTLWFALAVFSTVLGIMTKEVVMTVPVMVMAAEWIFFSRDNKRPCLILAAFGVFLYVLFSKLLPHGGLNVLFQSFASESHDGDVLTPGYYLLTEMRVFLTFLRLLVVPVHQNLDYDYPASTGLFHPPLTVVGLCAFAGVAFLVFKLRRSLPLAAFGLAWVLITFSINLAPRSNVIFEHKLYLISFGFFLALAACLSAAVPNRGTLVKILCVMIVILGIAGFQRNKVWADELTLWQDSLKNSPQKARVNASLGRVYGSMGRLDQAVYYLSRAIALSPDNITYENRGVIYSLQGRNALALADFNKSIEMDRGYFPTYVKRSWVYQVQHQYKAAFADLERAIQLNPYFTDAYIERGILWAQLGGMQQAVRDFQRVLEIDPYNPQAARLRSYCLARMSHP